jgi:hypothetical protein
VSAYLNLFHAAENSVSTRGADPDVKAFFDSLHIERQGNRAVLTAAMPPAFLRKVVGEPLQELPASSEGKAMQSEESTPARKTPD